LLIAIRANETCRTQNQGFLTLFSPILPKY
jgi:hypothetical protein